jgi:xanthine dehydrogenase accessory factor
MMPAWLSALGEYDSAGEACVLVTVVAARGSTPREAGSKMLVAADAVHDTIGGGNLEFQCIAAARELLAQGDAAPTLRDFPLGPALGQCCGGHVSVLFEPLRPAALHLTLFGAGHVGRALVRLLADLPCRVRWIDQRSDAFPDPVPANVQPVVAQSPMREAAHVPAGSLALVMTHDHQQDFEIVAALLARDDLAWVGLIGSATKRARFARRLAAAGLPATAIARLACPIGVPGVEGKRPAEIAIAVAAQILQVRAGMEASSGSRNKGMKQGPTRLSVITAGCGGIGCNRAECA